MTVSKKLKPVEEVGKSFVEMHKLGEYWGSMSQHVQFLRSEVGNKVFKDALKVASKKGYKQALRFIYNAVPKEVALEMDAVYLAGRHGMNRKKLYAKGLSAYKRTESYAKAVAAMKQSIAKRPSVKKGRKPEPAALYAKSLSTAVDSIVKASHNSLSADKMGSLSIITQFRMEISTIAGDRRLSNTSKIKKLGDIYSQLSSVGIATASFAINSFVSICKKSGYEFKPEDISKLNTASKTLDKAIYEKAGSLVAELKDKYNSNDNQIRNAMRLNLVFNTGTDSMQKNLMRDVLKDQESQYGRFINSIIFENIELQGLVRSRFTYEFAESERQKVKIFIRTGRLNDDRLYNRLRSIFGATNWNAYHNAAAKFGVPEISLINNNDIKSLNDLRLSHLALKETRKLLG